MFAHLHGSSCAKRDRADSIRLGNDLEPWLFQKDLLVEVCLDRTNFVSIDGDEVCPWQGYRASRRWASCQGASISVAHHPLRCDGVVARLGSTDDLKGEVGEGCKEATGMSSQSGSRERRNSGVAIGSALGEGGDDSGRVTPIPGIKVVLCNVDWLHHILLCEAPSWQCRLFWVHTQHSCHQWQREHL